MRKIVLLLSLSLLANVGSFGQNLYYAAELLYKTGEIKTGYAKVPNVGDDLIQFKNVMDDKGIRIKSVDLATIIFTLENGVTHILERCAVKYMRTKKSGEIVIDTPKGEGWLYRKYTHEKMNFYISGDTYFIRKDDGVFNVMSVGNMRTPIHISYYMRRPSEKECTLVSRKENGIPVFLEKFYRNTASTYLSDNKELAERIKKKEFKMVKQIEEIYKIYISD